MFVPKITITGVPVDATSMVVTDTTDTIANGDTTGYDSVGTYAYYPLNNTQWTKIVTAQLLGGTATEYLFDPLTDRTGTSTGTVTIGLTDGAWLVTVYFLVDATSNESVNWDYTIGGATKVLTRVGTPDPWLVSGAVPGIFDGVYGICEPAADTATLADINKIVSVTSSVLTLTNATTLSPDDGMTLVFRAQKYVLVMNEGEQSLISDIGDMALAEVQGQGCNETKSCLLTERLMMKLAAQIAFNCGNYQKAHNAALLFNKSTTNILNCPDC